MDDNLAIFMIMAVAIGAAVILTSLTAFLRGRQRASGGLGLAGGPDEASMLASENGELRSQVKKLEDRLRVLEAIATDPAARIEREIECLR